MLYIHTGYLTPFRFCYLVTYPLYPPPLIREGEIIYVREAPPLFDSPQNLRSLRIFTPSKERGIEERRAKPFLDSL